MEIYIRKQWSRVREKLRPIAFLILPPDGGDYQLHRQVNLAAEQRILRPHMQKSGLVPLPFLTWQ